MQIIFASALIFLATITRLLPHLPNFSPVLAVALFSGIFIKDKRLAVSVPLIIMLITDLIIGFHQTMLAVYLCFFLMVIIGFSISDKINIFKALGATVAGSLIFFVVTNFYFWLVGGLYQMNLEGLTDCYVRAIPFYRTAVLGDLIYMGALYGSFAVGMRYYPSLSTSK